ncbi:ubiquitin-related domain-containing protein [Lasiosphaeria hispida]|uniref:Ubiquitin-related domain-containing protein n=1 Tax=Lasiosphaeria hispida TaxID=260671 RepID=A0AAJ0HKN5_9PEZI|nr:ubiquitin-related domain-containing protein [Lasiosphaeria hispida]
MDSDIPITVRTLAGSPILELQVCPGWIISQIREKIFEIKGIPTSQQLLLFEATPLHDDHTAQSYGMLTGAVVHLMQVVPRIG